MDSGKGIVATLVVAELVFLLVVLSNGIRIGMDPREQPLPTEIARVEVMADSVLSLEPGGIIELAGGERGVVMGKGEVSEKAGYAVVSWGPGMSDAYFRPTGRPRIRTVYPVTHPEWNRLIREWFAGNSSR